MLREQRLSRYETAEDIGRQSFVRQFEHTRQERFEASSNGTFTAVTTSHWDAPVTSEEQGVLVN